MSAVLLSGAAAAPTRALVNLSIRTPIDGEASPGVIAFQVEGAAPKTVLIRAVGPSLRLFGVQNVLSDPLLTVHDASGAVIASNDDWGPADPMGIETAVRLARSPGDAV